MADQISIPRTPGSASKRLLVAANHTVKLISIWTCAALSFGRHLLQKKPYSMTHPPCSNESPEQPSKNTLSRHCTVVICSWHRRGSHDNQICDLVKGRFKYLLPNFHLWGIRDVAMAEPSLCLGIPSQRRQS